MGHSIPQTAIVVLDTKLAVVVSLRAGKNGLLQWSQSAGAGTGTVAVYGSARDEKDDQLTDLDPVTNAANWSQLLDGGGNPITFTSQPGGANTSGLFGFVNNGTPTLLVVFTIVGSATLELLAFVQEGT